MLYDKRWDKPKVKIDVCSVQGILDWLAKQNPATSYEYRDIQDCLLTRYFRASGFRWAFTGVSQVNYSRFFLPPLFRKSFPHEMDMVAVGFPRTYGAALDRARELAGK